MGIKIAPPALELTNATSSSALEPALNLLKLISNPSRQSISGFNQWRHCGSIRSQTARELLYNHVLESSGDSRRHDGLLYPGPHSSPESGAIALDSNVVLFVRFGDWATGRCTLDSREYPGNYGLCTFSNGVGTLAGFTARIDVSPFQNTPTDVDYYWNGTYSFTPSPQE